MLSEKQKQDVKAIRQVYQEFLTFYIDTHALELTKAWVELQKARHEHSNIAGDKG